MNKFMLKMPKKIILLLALLASPPLLYVSAKYISTHPTLLYKQNLLLNKNISKNTSNLVETGEASNLTHNKNSGGSGDIWKQSASLAKGASTITLLPTIQNTNSNTDTKPPKFTLIPLNYKLIEKKQLAGFTLYKLQIGQNVKVGQYYILDTSKYHYDELVLELATNAGKIHIWATNVKPKTYNDLTRHTLYNSDAIAVSGRYSYVSNIVYTNAPYLIIKPTTTTKLTNIELWYYTAKASDTTRHINQDNNNSSNLANTANLKNFIARTNSVADYATAYTKDMSSGLKVSCLNIIPRSQWGTNPATWDAHHPNLPINDIHRLKYIPEYSCRWMPEYIQPRRFVIHHTVTRNYPTDPYREIREIYIYHTYSRDWGDIGYNFLIDSEGRIFEGKIGGVGVKGYHAFEAANDMAVGIALIGNFTYSNPTNAQLNALSKLLAEQANIFGIPLKYCGGGTLTEWLDQSCTVFGHRHIYVWSWDSNDWYKKPTACPGEYFVTHGKLAQAVSTAENLRQNGYTSIKEAKTWANNLINSIRDRQKYFLELTFKGADTKTLQELSNYIPKYTGLWHISLMKDKKAYITLKSYDNGSCGVVVPPLNWHGYDDCGPHGCMYFPASGGIKERLITILIALKLNPYIDQIKLVEQPQWAQITANINNSTTNSITNFNMLKNKECIKDIGD